MRITILEKRLHALVLDASNLANSKSIVRNNATVDAHGMFIYKHPYLHYCKLIVSLQ